MNERGYLAFSRKPGECFTIYTAEGEINICIRESSFNRIKLNIEAPKSVKILRDELINKGDNNEQKTLP